MIFYSATTGGFYDPAIHISLFIEQVDTDPGTGETVDRRMVPDPDGPIADAVAITLEERNSLLDAQAAGQVIVADATGHPVATAPAPPSLEDVKVQLCVRIDDIASQVYDLIGSASPGRLAEYQQAETEATAFKTGGYAGAAPPTVACWAQAQGWTDQHACDDILATAAAWRGALVAIRTARLIGKANVNATSDTAAAQVAGDAAIASIRAVPAGI